MLLPAASVSQLARRAVAAAAAKSSSKGKSGAVAGKGFGPAKPTKVLDEGCPCGSGQFYKVRWDVFGSTAVLLLLPCSPMLM
jgi:hypothetical protein